ncbi:hydroxyacylglutathione hydrolase [Syncephalis pseudoplumigaleata]|uniref:hydroxyacylglutathione hydrolase n=1 Tax=Syncephalis pseudoplumigaleata TaxID=1712513 RepID=A0A4P9Z1M6_9FUNG|nr:hydroxyacylglutathione hydrolase [Syncephalis pseudoplumigaleata]|eukprot:RKP26245.1 hydroxyacylglutathione hydrolase [Syncephalis pseudoplumigaleata]
MIVEPVPCLGDNYAYLLVDPATREAAAIDPVTPERVLSALKQYDARLTTVLTTHHHSDHSGGNSAIIKELPDLRVVGGDERIPALSYQVADGQEFSVGGLVVRALATPCHTSGHICYYVVDPDAKDEASKRVVFTGDTLFIGGCGRFFEGTAEQMQSSLDKLAQLPGDTRVYCGHEYTLANLKFASTVDPDNAALKASGTIQSTIASELAFNPFMRTSHAALQQATGQTSSVAVMAKLREMKNNFRG